LAAIGAAVVAPNVADAKECTKSHDWETMSLEARNLAFNNVAHVGPEFARKKTEEWAAASATLRAQRPQHLNLAYAQADRTKWAMARAQLSRNCDINACRLQAALKISISKNKNVGSCYPFSPSVMRFFDLAWLISSRDL
jgi:hypothetical protein